MSKGFRGKRDRNKISRREALENFAGALFLGAALLAGDEDPDTVRKVDVRNPPERPPYRRRPLQVVAHSVDGQSHLATLEDVRRAVSLKANALDIDVQRTASSTDRSGKRMDPELAAYHDESMIWQPGYPWPFPITTRPAWLVEDLGIPTIEEVYATIEEEAKLQRLPEPEFHGDLKKWWSVLGVPIYKPLANPRDANLMFADMLLEHTERQRRTRVGLSEPQDVLEMSCLVPRVFVEYGREKKDLRSGDDVVDLIETGAKNRATSISVPWGVVRGDEGVDLIALAHQNRLAVKIWDLITPPDHRQAMLTGADDFVSNDVPMALSIVHELEREGLTPIR